MGPGLRRDDVRGEYAASKHLEIFAMLPLRNFRLEPFNLGILDVDVIVDELFSERPAEKRIVVERKHRLTQRLRQQRRLGLIGRVGGGAGIKLAVDTVEARENLRSHVEIG